MSSATEYIFQANAAIERRFYPRAAPSGLIYVTFGQINDALLLNVSENGVLVSTPHELDSNFVARLSMNLNGLPRVIQVYARVLWRSESQKRAGIQFIDLSEHDREQIRKWQALESSREPMQSSTEEPKPGAQMHSAAADDVRAARKSLADAAAASLADIEGITASGKHVGSGEHFAEDARPADVGTAYGLQVHPVIRTGRRREIESAIAVSIWVAVPIIIALGIILLIRSGALPNPLAPSAIDRKDSGAATATGTESPELNHANGSPNTTQGTSKALRMRRNADSDRALLDSSAIVNGEDEKTFEISGTAETESASANAQPGITSVQNFKRPDVSDSRFDQAKANTTTPTASPDLPRTRAAPEQPEHLDAPKPELSTTNELAINPATPSDSSGWGNATRVPKAAAGASYLARKLRPGPVSVNPSEGEVINVRPEGHGTSFVTLPGARVLESGQMTLRIQRSVLMQGGVKWWPLHRSKKVTLGELVSRVDPQVPQRSILSDATVTVRAAVDEDGRVESVQRVSGPDALVPAVSKAVQEWRYQPTLVDGKPVETQADIEVQFHAPAVQIAKP